jgi:NhaP-type Na+/H+ or K+/H+ antiporter
MLLAGLLLRNLPHPLNVACNYHAEVASELRKVAYCIILCRAGLVLDVMAVRKMLGPALRLAFAPNVIEASVAAILIKVVLGLPWLLALAGGFLLSAISPAIVLPTILSLSEEGYGQDKGIASLVVVAAGLDDVLSITAFGIFSNMGIPKPGQHDNGNLTWNIVKAPLQIFGGMLGGCLVGLMFVPITKAVGNHRRTLFFICLSVVGVFGCDSLEMPGMGAIFVLAFGADVLMRSVEQTQALKADLQWLWDIMQPFLFGTIGAEVDLAQLDSHTVFYGLLILVSALVCRCVTASVVSGQSFTLKERAFFACAWVPKATVQAALAGRTLELATARHAGKEFQNYGTQLRNLAILAILFTAPIGALLINVSAPRLLSRQVPEELGKAASNC